MVVDSVVHLGKLRHPRMVLGEFWAGYQYGLRKVGFSKRWLHTSPNSEIPEIKTQGLSGFAVGWSQKRSLGSDCTLIYHLP